MKNNRSTVIWSTGAALLVALWIVATFWSFDEMQKTSDERKRTFIVLDCANVLLSNLGDAETGQRGYVLTGAETFLEPYLKVNKDILARLDRLQQLTLLKEAHKKADELIPLVNQKMEEMAQVIEVRRSQGLMAAVAKISNLRGKALMDAIRAVMADFIQCEAAVLAQRDAKVQTAMHWMFAVLVSTSLLTLLFAATFVYARKRRADTILESEVRYQQLLEKAPLPLFHVTKEGLIDFRNERFLHVFGYTTDDVPTQTEWLLRAFPDPQYRHWVTTQWDAAVRQAAAEDRDIQEIECKVTCKNRAERIITISGIKLGEEYLVTFFDLTARKQEEENLRRMATVVRDSNDAITISDFAGQITAWNRGAELMYGYREAEALQMSIWRITPPAKMAEKKAFIARLIAGEAVTSFETQRLTKDGRVLDVWLTVTKLMDAGGKPIGIASTERDITARKRTVEEVHRLNAELEQRVHDRTAELEAVNKELEAFSYSVSHDLRAPLRHVQGYVDLLARETGAQLSEKGRRYMQTITAASHDMGELIDDLLAFSRMGRAEMIETGVNLDTLVQETLRDLETTAAGRNIVWIIPPLPAVLGDPAMLKLVLANLLGNAVKFTRTREQAVIEMGFRNAEGGGQKAAEQLVKDTPRDSSAPQCAIRNAQSEIVFFVRDNGVGFDPQYTHKLFGVFQRLHRAEDFEGTGIGLANVRRIITRHGGRTWAEGQLNEGATFYFTLKTSQ